MYSRWELWLFRALLCLFQMIFVFTARFYLCDGAAPMRDKWRYGKKKCRPLDTGRQPRFLVWLLYTDIRSVRNQDASLRLNMMMWIAALFCMTSELLLGWLKLTMAMRILLAVCAVFFGLCYFIGVCMDHKRTYGSRLILYAKERSSAKYESSIFDLIILALFCIIARCYFDL